MALTAYTEQVHCW